MTVPHREIISFAFLGGQTDNKKYLKSAREIKYNATIILLNAKLQRRSEWFTESE
jgi:hypothetical protein